MGICIFKFFFLKRGWYLIIIYFIFFNENEYNSYKVMMMFFVVVMLCNKKIIFGYDIMLVVNILSKRDKWFWYIEVCLMLIFLWNIIFFELYILKLNDILWII